MWNAITVLSLEPSIVKPPSVLSPSTWNLKPRYVSISPDTKALTVLKSEDVTAVSERSADKLLACKTM